MPTPYRTHTDEVLQANDEAELAGQQTNLEVGAQALTPASGSVMDILNSAVHELNFDDVESPGDKQKR